MIRMQPRQPHRQPLHSLPLRVAHAAARHLVHAALDVVEHEEREVVWQGEEGGGVVEDGGCGWAVVWREEERGVVGEDMD